MAFIKKINSKLFSFYYILKNFAMFKYDKKKIKVVESPMKLRYYFNVEIEEILVMMKCFFVREKWLMMSRTICPTSEENLS